MVLEDWLTQGQAEYAYGPRPRCRIQPNHDPPSCTFNA